MTHKIIKLKLTENLQQLLISDLRCRCWSLIKGSIFSGWSPILLLITHSLTDLLIHSYIKHLLCLRRGTKDARGIRHDTYLQEIHDLTKCYTCTQLLHNKCWNSNTAKEKQHLGLQERGKEDFTKKVSLSFTCGQKGHRDMHTLYTPAHAHTFFHSKIKWPWRDR